MLHSDLSEKIIGAAMSFEPRIYTDGQQGDAQGTCAGASEPDSLASKLADSPVSESLTRFASGPAFRALREMIGIQEMKMQDGDWLASGEAFCKSIGKLA